MVQDGARGAAACACTAAMAPDIVFAPSSNKKARTQAGTPARPLPGHRPGHHGGATWGVHGAPKLISSWHSRPSSAPNAWMLRRSKGHNSAHTDESMRSVADSVPRRARGRSAFASKLVTAMVRLCLEVHMWLAQSVCPGPVVTVARCAQRQCVLWEGVLAAVSVAEIRGDPRG